MTKFYTIFSLTLFAVLFTACSSDERTAPVGAATTEVTTETALSHLRGVLDALCATRSETPSIDAAEVTAYLPATTRSQTDKPLAYLVNFDEGGYAVLGADSRQAPVVALVRSGRLTPQMLTEALEAAEAGAATDAATMMRASIARYLDGKIREPQSAAYTRATPSVTILEQRDSMMTMAWSPAEAQFAATERTTIAFLQTLIYNANYNDLFFTPYRDKVLNWSIITGVCAYRHFEQAPQLSRDACTIMLFPSFEEVSNLAAIVSALGRTEAYEGIAVAPLTEENVRQMIFIDRKPTVACFEGTTMEKEGWAIDGWLKMSVGGAVSSYAYCKFGKDLRGSDNGFYEIEAVTKGIRLEQSILRF